MATKNKTILHIDGDAFFVGVEIAKNPKLKGLPVVTGEERGIVSALSYEAKALGIKRGMPIFKITKEFPNVIILPGDYKAYVQYSGKMFDIVRRYADDVEEYSIDECFADLTGLDLTLKMSHKRIAERIKEDVVKELQLSVSVGIGPTKVLAKVASKWKKPDGLTVIEKEDIKDFLSKTPIEKIWGIGPQTSILLKEKKILTAHNFIEKDLAWIRQNLTKPYETIWRELQGLYTIEINPVPKTEYSSIQKTRSFHPATNDKDFLLSQLSKHTEEACAKARYFGLVPQGFSFFLKTKDFRYQTYFVKLPYPTNVPEVLLLLIEENFEKVYKKNVLYRTSGITLTDLAPDAVSQSDLFGFDKRIRKLEAVHKQIDSLEEKFGRQVVHLGSTHKALKGKTLGTDSDELERNLLFL